MFSRPAWFHRSLLLIPILAAVAACGQKDPFLPTGPSTPPTVRTETFTGTLTRNSAYTHPFSVTDSGDVSVFLITSADARDASNDSIPIGVSLGTWNGAACAIVIANDKVAPGSSITGRATAAGNLCVRVYDVGFVPAASTYELLIDHY
jgi:predicted small lipoprotein YifL